MSKRRDNASSARGGYPRTDDDKPLERDMRIVQLGREQVEIAAFSECVKHASVEHAFRLYWDVGCYIEVTRLQLIAMLMMMERTDLDARSFEHHRATIMTGGYDGQET